MRTASAAPAAPSPDVAAVADNVVELLRSFSKARARLLAAAAHDVEWSAHVVLKCIASEGQLRVSDVADFLHSDPSTVSRQVAAMVRDGLLERQSDPEDGRASILALTAKAGDVLAEHERARLAHFESMLSDWNTSDLSRFATLLRRFTDDFEQASSTLMTEQPEPSGPAERKQ